MRIVAVALVVSCGLTVAACGGSSASATDRTADGVRALVKEFAHDWRAGRYADACQLVTPRQQAALGAVTDSSCTRALATARGVIGDAKLARDEKAADSLDVTVSGDTATSPNPESPGESSHYVYRAGHWRIG
jgi:hypothetical protein